MIKACMSKTRCGKFILKMLASFLECPIVAEETLAISAFGSTEAKVCNFQVVAVTLAAAEEQIQIDALVSSTIAAPISIKIGKD